MVGDIVTYELTVRNASLVDAPNAVLVDEPLGQPELYSSDPSQGSCGTTLPLVCRLGTVEAGQVATVRVRLKVTQVGEVRNFGVVGPGTSETQLSDNHAVAHAVAVHKNKVKSTPPKSKPAQPKPKPTPKTPTPKPKPKPAPPKSPHCNGST
jgi:cell division septation protein DedD